MTTEDRVRAVRLAHIEEIREAYEGVRPEDRDPADVAIGALLREIDALTKAAAAWTKAASP